MGKAEAPVLTRETVTKFVPNLMGTGGGVDTRRYVRGPKGVVQFITYDQRVEEGEEVPEIFKVIYPLYADLGYHSPVPMYEGQRPFPTECDVLGGMCYYDGSGLAALRVGKVLEEMGEEAMWMALEQFYRDTFEGGET